MEQFAIFIGENLERMIAMDAGAIKKQGLHNASKTASYVACEQFYGRVTD